MYKIYGNFIRKIDQKKIIPKDESNYDYKEYLRWLAEGNVPEPEFTLEQLKENKSNDITVKRNRALSELFTEWDEDTWDANEETSNRIANALGMIKQAEAIGMPVPSLIPWRTYDNKDRLLSIEELTQMGAAVFLAQQQIWAKQAILKNSIEAATTEEEINAIDW